MKTFPLRVHPKCFYDPTEIETWTSSMETLKTDSVSQYRLPLKQKVTFINSFILFNLEGVPLLEANCIIHVTVILFKNKYPIHSIEQNYFFR